jgi:hypothetical protein
MHRGRRCKYDARGDHRSVCAIEGSKSTSTGRTFSTVSCTVEDIKYPKSPFCDLGIRYRGTCRACAPRVRSRTSFRLDPGLGCAFAAACSSCPAGTYQTEASVAMLAGHAVGADCPQRPKPTTEHPLVGLSCGDTLAQAACYLTYMSHQVRNAVLAFSLIAGPIR